MNEEMIMTDGCMKFCERLWYNKFGDLEKFPKAVFLYLNIKDFDPDGNVFDHNNFDEDILFIVRCATQYYLTKAFKAMKIDLNNPNVAEDLDNGNIGTPGRIAKIWTGSNINDDRELGSGRWSKKPRMASFPNTNGTDIPITKKVDIISSCSHHFIPFSSIAKKESYAVISYIPHKFVLGISKLQRIANWISLRFFLQEDLTKALYDEISKVAETDSVYVCLYEMTHGCETMRGAKSKNGSFTTEHYGGAFKQDKSLIPIF